MLERTPTSRLTLVEVLDRVLDKGIVIDALGHVSVAGTELITVSAHVVVASFETYLGYFSDGAGDAKPRVVEFPAFLPDQVPRRP